MGTYRFWVFAVAILAAQPSLEAGPGTRRPSHDIVVSRTRPNNGVARAGGATDPFLHSLARQSAWVAHASLQPTKADPHTARLLVRIFEVDGGRIYTRESHLDLQSWGTKNGLEQAVLVLGPQPLLTQVYYDRLPEGLPEEWAKTLGGVLVRAKFDVNAGRKDQTWLEFRSPHQGRDPMGGDVFFSTTDEPRMKLRTGWNNGDGKVWLEPGQTGTVELSKPPALGDDVIRFDAFVSTAN